jgi:hypothetical protein
MINGLPPLSTVPVEASSAQSAPPLFPGGAQQIKGLFTPPRGRAEVLDVVALQPVPVDVQIVPTKTTPPALAAGTERGKPGDVSDPGE